MMDDQSNGRTRDAGEGPDRAGNTDDEGMAAHGQMRPSRRRVRLYVGQRLIAAGEALLRQPWDTVITPDYDAEPSRG